MLLDEFGTFHKVYLAICFDEVVAHCVDVVDDYQLDIFLLHTLREVEEDFVIVFNVFAELHDDVIADSHFGDGWLMLNEEVFLHFVKALFIEMLAGNDKEGLAPQTTLLLGKNGVEEELNGELGLTRA